MEKKKGLVDRILSSAKDDDAGSQGRVHRKKITLNDLKTVIEEYVQRTAGMGDPELRSRIVQMELGHGTLREQNASLQRSLESARSGWKAAQDELAAFTREGAGRSGDLEADLAAARKEVLEVHEELARLKGKLAASEMALGESGGSLSSLREEKETLTQKLDASRRNEKKLKVGLQERTARLKAAEETHRREIEDLEDRLEALSAGYDYVDIVEPLDWDGTLEAAKAAKILAKELSVDAQGPARETLRTVARRCDQIYLELEAERDEETARLDDVVRGQADFAAVLRLNEIHNRMAHVSMELTYLSMLTSVFMSDEE